MGGAGEDAGCGLAIGPDGAVHVTGYFEQTADFGVGTDGHILSSNGGKDVFISTLDSNGNFVCATSVGGPGDDYGYGIAVAPDGSVCTTGSFTQTATFNSGDAPMALTSAGGAMFLSQSSTPQAISPGPRVLGERKTISPQALPSPPTAAFTRPARRSAPPTSIPE